MFPLTRDLPSVSVKYAPKHRLTRVIFLILCMTYRRDLRLICIGSMEICYFLRGFFRRRFAVRFCRLLCARFRRFSASVGVFLSSSAPHCRVRPAQIRERFFTAAFVAEFCSADTSFAGRQAQAARARYAESAAFRPPGQ